ncbi:MAG: DUF3325 family protein [Alcaligenaceae bacterium]|nr:MAG: DUF3325 family protein [Alcaligenaceae bacterium]
MMAPLFSFVSSLAGFGLISLTMQRHADMWSERARARWLSKRGKAALALAGTASIVGSYVLALHDNLQLGTIYWSAYAMISIMLITGTYAFADRLFVLYRANFRCRACGISRD